MTTTNPTCTKELADEAEELIINIDSLSHLIEMMVYLYQFMQKCLKFNDEDSTDRIYDIILKATERFKKLAEDQAIKAWDGN